MKTKRLAIILTINFLIMPVFAPAADEIQSAARNADAVGAPADRNTPVDTGTATAPSAGTADLRVTPTPTSAQSKSPEQNMKISKKPLTY